MALEDIGDAVNNIGSTFKKRFKLSSDRDTEDTLKAGGPIYLVSMPGEVKDPTQGIHM